jgi:molybdopterin synthase sulfur carrier subunit
MIKIVFFASLREELGVDDLYLEVGEIVNVQNVIDKLAQTRGLQFVESLSGDKVLIAVNQEMVNPCAPVRDDDEVAFFPPVTGG